MSKPVHSGRAHAPWSASSTARLIACPGAFQAAQHVPEPPTSEAAAQGTAAHELAEECLRTKRDAIQYAGTTRRVDRFSFEVDDEMIYGVQMYLDHVRELHLPTDDAVLLHEVTFRISDTPIPTGGTADTAGLDFTDGILDVVDLKYGRGVAVEAVGNAQARMYGLGAIESLPVDEIHEVRLTIVQPRIDHPAGYIRTETITVHDLRAWKRDVLLPAQHRALEPDAPRLPGAHCQFCPAASTCPAVRQLAYSKALAAAEMFDELDDHGQVQGPKRVIAPAELSLEQLADVLDHADMISNWLNAVRARAQGLAESGATIPGYELVQRRGSRGWISDDDAIIAAALEWEGIPPGVIWQPPKLSSPAQVEKGLGTKKHPGVLALWGWKPTGFNLASVGKTTRPKALPAPSAVFDVLPDEDEGAY